MADDTADPGWIDCHDLRRDPAAGEHRKDKPDRISLSEEADAIDASSWRGLEDDLGESGSFTLIDPDMPEIETQAAEPPDVVSLRDSGPEPLADLSEEDDLLVSLASEPESDIVSKFDDDAVILLDPVEDESDSADEAAEREALEQAQAEARAKAQEEEKAKAKAAERARREAEAKRKAEQEALAQAEAKRKAEARAKAEAEARAREKAEELAAEKAREEARVKARKAAQEKAAREKAEAEAKRKAEEEAKRKAQAEAKRKAEEEAKRKAQAEAKRKAEEEAKRKAQAEAKRKAEEEAKRKAQAEAKRKAEEEAKRKAQAEAKRKAEEEAKRKAEAEAKRKAEDEAKRKAAEEAKKKAKEDAEAQEAIKAQSKPSSKAVKPKTPAAQEPQPAEQPELAEAQPPADLGEGFRRLIRANGPISLAQFMGESNARYYASRDPLGGDEASGGANVGDFITAPEVSQMFGELVGLWLADLWVRMGSSERVQYVELGPGRGTLASDALRAAGRYGFDPPIHFVEGSPTLRRVQLEAFPKAIHHHDLSTLPDDRPLLIVANEFFDALPIHQLVCAAQGWHEKLVGLEDDQFVFVAGNEPMDALVPETWRKAPQGTMIETSPAACALMAEIASRLSQQGGAALIIDYGPFELRSGSTLQAIRNHRHVDPLAHPGEADLTAHVDFELLRSVALANGADLMGIEMQGDWLRNLGIDIRLEALQRREPDKADLVQRQYDRLVGDDQMGALFKVMGICGRRWPMGVGFEQR